MIKAGLVIDKKPFGSKKKIEKAIILNLSFMFIVPT
jgi:hypothetical protein